MTMFEKRRARREAHQQHHRLMRAARDLVGLLGTAPASPADLVALVFGDYALEIGEEEAARYLDAARVDRGRRLPVERPEPQPGTDDQEELTPRRRLTPYLAAPLTQKEVAMWDCIKHAVQTGAADEARIADEIADEMAAIADAAETRGDMVVYRGHVRVAAQLRERAAMARSWLTD